MMNKKEIFKKVGGIITELNEQYQYLSHSPENLNELELELFSANANFLSDHIAVLVKLNENSKKSAQTDPVMEKNSLVSLGSVQEEQELNIKSGKSGLEKDTDEVSDNNELSGPPLSEEERRFIEEETKLKPVESEEEDEIKIIDKQEEVLNEPFIKEVVISERTIALPIDQTVPEPAPSINDLLSKQSLQGTVASQFSQRRIKDLKSMISLNDKLLFVRDLFNGYSLAYSEAIELLNRFDRIEAAENFLKQNYAQKNKWEDKQASADKFYEILNERFK